MVEKISNNTDVVVPSGVHDYLSRQGQKGADITRSLVEYAKKKLEEEGMPFNEFEKQVIDGTWTGEVKRRKSA